MTMSNAARNFMWDFFLDDCTEKGIDPDTVDFDTWCDGVVDEAIDEALWG